MKQSRKEIFQSFSGHAWWGRRIESLKLKERAELEGFLEAQQSLSNDDFVHALNRMFLGREAKPKNWTLILDILQAVASAERSA